MSDDLLIPDDDSLVNKLGHVWSNIPASVLFVQRFNKIMYEETGIIEFIPLSLIISHDELEIAERKKLLNKLGSFISGLQGFYKRTFGIPSQYTLPDKYEDPIKLLRKNINSAKKMVSEDDELEKRLAKRFAEIKFNEPMSDQINEKDIIKQFMAELKIARKDLQNNTTAVKKLTKKIEQPDVEISSSSFKTRWRSSLKDASIIIRNNYEQDKKLPPDKRKYRSLTHASNDFFNSHEFPEAPDLTAEKLLANVKQYR